MADTSSLVFAGIAPHPPIMVPEVGREAIADVRASIEAMSDLTERVIASGAETVVLIRRTLHLNRIRLSRTTDLSFTATSQCFAPLLLRFTPNLTMSC